MKIEPTLTEKLVEQEFAQAQRACDALNRNREFVCKAALSLYAHDEAESVRDAIEQAQELAQALEREVTSAPGSLTRTDKWTGTLEPPTFPNAVKKGKDFGK